MRPNAIIGVLLITLGLGALVFQGVNYTTRETIIDIGPIEATADRERRLPLPPILGVAAVALGAILLVSGLRKRA